MTRIWCWRRWDDEWDGRALYERPGELSGRKACPAKSLTEGNGEPWIEPVEILSKGTARSDTIQKILADRANDELQYYTRAITILRKDVGIKNG